MSDETTTAELRHVDPGTLVMLDNVRSNAKTDAKMVGSIKQHGVLQPITARECDDGLVVLYGHRRTDAGGAPPLSSSPGAPTDTATTRFNRMHSLPTQPRRTP